MSEKTGSASISPNSINTLIGADMHVKGDISCTGVLRVQGTVLGNVACDGGPDGHLVVDGSGSVTGTINATHIAVRGRIMGPVQSSQSIEIHPGGSLVGDVSFKEISIHAGGVINGLLNPAVLMDSSKLVQNRPPQTPKEPAASNGPARFANTGKFVGRLGGARRIGMVAVFAVAAVAVVWMSRDLVTTRSADNATPETDSARKDAATPPPLPAGGNVLRNDPKTVAADTAPLASSSSVGAGDASQTASPIQPGKNQEEIVTVRGANPNRPAGVFLLISNEPSILYRKKRDDPSDGSRINIPQGEKVSVSITDGDLIRVAKGRDVTIFFQGQKVPKQIIDSGSWINFVPRTANSNN